MTTSHTENHASFNMLRTRLTGLLLLPEDAGYEQARQLWNGGVKTNPAAIVRCVNVQDVIETVRWARSHDLPLSVRGGGHDFAGRALREHGVVIDCSQMRAVTIDSKKRTASIEGGATAGDLMQSAQHYGLATTTGGSSIVGMAGFTLGGGYGSLMGAYGLGADNLLSAQVVTADGQLLTANAEEHADLLWGLRGGGGNFGVVVSLQYRLHPLTTVLAGTILYPLEQASAVLQRFNEFLATAPDELTVDVGFIMTPGGEPALFCAPVYCGALAAGELAFAPLRTFGKPLVEQIKPVAYNSFLRQRDASFPSGRHYHSQTQSLHALQSEAIEAFVEQGLPFPSPFSVIGLQHFHGAASRVGVSESAFALRQNHLMLNIVAAWDDQSQDEEQRHIQWARSLSQALAPYAIKGGYINLLDKTEQERVPLAFGPNYERLLSVKRTYDPDDIFSSTIGHVVP